MAATPARAAIGFPPNVAACMPGEGSARFRRGQHRGPGDTAADRFGQRHDVGRDAEMLIGKPLPRSATTGLHFVEDQQ